MVKLFTVFVVCVSLNGCTVFTQHNKSYAFPKDNVKTIYIYKTNEPDLIKPGYIEKSKYECKIYTRVYPKYIKQAIVQCFE